MISGGAVVYELVYPHSPERVWRALAEPAELAQWLMPSAGFAAVAGQRFTMSCEPFGAIEAEVLAADPPRRLSLRWVNAAFGSTVVTFELSAVADGTLLRMEHDGWTDAAAAARDQFDSGWHAKLGSGLRSVLDVPDVPGRG
jgi:uncharacterized protein YndB with AHSA1/START domain